MSIIKNLNNKVVGQDGKSIDIGDKGVVTKMKRKKNQLTFRYVPSQKEYTPNETKLLEQKENELINYIINLPVFQEALAK